MMPLTEPLPQHHDVATMPSRVLDDPFHFMDRILRLLPKMHSAFDAFCSDFSKAIFLTDKDDEANVRHVFKAKGIDWKYVRLSKSNILNR